VATIVGVDTVADRQQQRRAMMLRAGVPLLGDPDYRTVNVRTVCRTTGITERYFYEAFGTRDEYVRALYHEISEHVRRALDQEVQSYLEDGGDPDELAGTAVTAFVELVIDTPQVGRALLLAPYRDRALADQGLSHMADFFAVVASAMPAELSETVRRLASVSLVGALTAVFTEYLEGRLQADRDELVEHCVLMVRLAYAAMRE
jgi:AcrR family transcriptional regulator